jgi:hypothetical protein
LTSWLDEHRRHLESRPAKDGLLRMARSVARGSRPVRIKRLKGGLGASTHRVTLERRSGRSFDVVVKRYRGSDTAAGREWARLRFASSTMPIASPEPVALDSDGTWFGAPALVMSFLAGRPELAFDDDGRRYAQIAEAILANAQVSTAKLPKAMRRPPFRFEPPEALKRTALVDRAVEVI